VFLFGLHPVRASSYARPGPQWINIMNDTSLRAYSPFLPLACRDGIRLVFDAVNGMTRVPPLHVRPSAPHGASQRAAASNAYVILLTLIRAEPALAAQYNASLGTLALTEMQNHRRGVAWDKPSLRHLGVETNGRFAPPPLPLKESSYCRTQPPSATGVPSSANAPGAGTQLATMTRGSRAGSSSAAAPYSLTARSTRRSE